MSFLSRHSEMLLLSLALSAAHGCDHPTEASANGPQRAKPIKVDSLTVEQAAMPNSVLLAGSLKANQESDLAANATGKVLKTTVERGSYVSQGQMIAQLDSRLASLVANESEANLETAKTQQELAKQDCARYDQLLAKGAVAQSEYDKQTASCKTALSNANAAAERASQSKQNLGDATIRAPFSGLIAERYVSVGEYVHPDTKVAHLVDIDPLRLELTIPEQNMGAVKQGQAVQFQVGAFPDQQFTGVVHYIGPSVRSSTRDLVFEAVVANKQKLLRPGLFATARLDAGTQNLPVVPKTALRQDGDTLRAFAIVDNQAGAGTSGGKHLEERVVQSGIEQGGKIAILNGLKAGDKIVAKPTDVMSDGQDVE